MVDTFNIAPYYDDFDESKQYVRILHRPGLAVQARELTQAQTIIQNQIKRFGNHIFKDGSKITGGQIFYNNKVKYLAVLPSFGGNPVVVEEWIGKIITGAVSGAQGRVVHVNAAENGDPPLFFLEMLTGESPTTSAEFDVNENVAVVSEGLAATVEAVDHFGPASIISINEGVYYVDGFFVFVNPQTLVLEKFSNEPSYRVGLTLEESIVTSGDDASLLNPARGTPNFSGIGADRYKVALLLDKKILSFTEDVDNAASEKFIELIRIEDGIIKSEVKYPIYSDVMNTIARRTFDESGDYTINPFLIRLSEHPSDDTLIRVGMEPGKAFVKGFEFETISTEYFDIPKSRDTTIEENREANAQLGNYVLVNDLFGTFDATQLIPVTLHNVVTSAISNQTDLDNSQIGTAYLRAVTYDSGTGANLTYRFYLIRIETDVSAGIADVNSIWASVFAGGRKANIDPTLGQDSGDTILFSAGFSAAVFPTPFTATKTLKPGSNLDTDYTTRRMYSATIFTSGTAAINVAGTDTFFGGSGALSNTNKRTHYLAVISSLTNPGATGYVEGDVIDFTSGARSITLSGGDQIATFNIDDAAFTAQVDIIATINLNLKPEKVKDLLTTTVLGVTLSSDIGDLEISDVFSIVEIRDTGDSNAVVTDRFDLDTGMRDTHYDHGSIRLKTGETVVGPLDVDIEYFSHTGTGYFSVDSYNGFELDEIPEYTFANGTVLSLGDAIDFRPRRVDGGDDFVVGVTGSDFVYPDTNIDFDIEFYLARVININLLSDLRFDAQLGESAIYPKAPLVPQNAMRLYELSIPAFTPNVAEIPTTYIDNRRYTMRDIGAIAKRIDRIEYYTALSLMEKNTNDLLVADTNGNELFKNGILVDPFKDHRIGDYTNVDYKASIDTIQGVLRPRALKEFYSLNFEPGESSGVTKTNDGITLDFDEEPFINQPLASKSLSLNPFSVAVWQGNVTISPQTDQWIDTITKPEQIVIQNTQGPAIPGEYQNLHYQPQQVFQSFGDSGTIRASGDSNQGRLYYNSLSLADSVNTSLGLLHDQITALAKSWQPPIPQTLGERVTDLNFIPYIRAQNISFSLTGMKPNTRLYIFFDNVDVTSFVTPTPLYTDTNGAISGTFALPNTDLVRFRTGQRDLKFTDSAANDDTTATTIGVAQFFAQGLIQTKVGATESTRPASVQRADPNDNRIVTDPVSRTLNSGRSSTAVMRDPIAQVFTVDANLFPNGLYATSVEIFFETKDTVLPVSLELRPTINGFPHSSTVIPFSNVTLNPNQVSVSDDATIPTKFTFRVPVYLAGGEYALVMTTNTENYKCFVAELGANVLGTQQRIVTQPYVGALFKSQNATIWTPELDEDLTFKMNCANYTVNSPATSVLEAEIPGADFEYDSFMILNNILQPPGVSYQVEYKHRAFPSGVFDANWTRVEKEIIENLTARAFLDASALDTSFKIRCTMSTTHETCSPLIDEERTNLILLQNIINNDATDEDLPSGGNAEAKYISRKVVLKDGFDATGLKVFLNAVLRAGTTLRVYAKVLAKDDPTPFELRPWTEIPRTGDLSTISGTDTEVIELEYENFDLLYDGFTDFKQWSLKIVMLSPSTTIIPTVWDMRAIAVS